jgi:hypothetical protein
LHAPAGLYEDVGEPSEGLYQDAITDQACIGPLMMGQLASYQGSGYTSAMTQTMLGEPARDSDKYVWRARPGLS